MPRTPPLRTAPPTASSAPDPSSFLPLSPPVFHVLLALGDGPLHGYGIMQGFEERTGGRETLLPGTLYSTLARMLDGGLVEELPEPPEPGADRRRRYYQLTELGRAVGWAEAERLAMLLGVARQVKFAPESP